MTKMKALAQTAISILLTRGDEQFANVDAASRFLAGGSGGIGGIGKLLETLSVDSPANGAAPSDMDNLIAGISASSDLPPAALAGFGAVLQSQFADSDQTPLTPSADQDATAGLLLSAMLQAFRSEPTFDAARRAAFIGNLGGLDDDERAAVIAALDTAVDPAQMARQVPPWLEPQVYLISVVAISPASPGPAAYLRAIAGQMAIGRATIDQIHDQLHVPRLDVAA